MVIDDHPIIHDGLQALLAPEKSISIDAAACSASESMEILETMQPDLIIIDLSLGDSDGTYLIQKIHHQFPRVHILVYSMSEENLFGERVAKAGARGYVMKTSEPANLKKAIHSIMEGNLFFSDKLTKRILKKKDGRALEPQSALDNLSNREMDVFKLIGEGVNSVNISERLDIRKNTVDTHRINIKKKLGLSNGKALDRMAYEVIAQGKIPSLLRAEPSYAYAMVNAVAEWVVNSERIPDGWLPNIAAFLRADGLDAEHALLFLRHLSRRPVLMHRMKALPAYRDLLGEIELSTGPVPIYLQRVPDGKGGHQWKFSNATVARIPEMWDELGIGPLAQYLKEPSIQNFLVMKKELLLLHMIPANATLKK